MSTLLEPCGHMAIRSRLRKISSNQPISITVRGLGYQFVAEPDKQKMTIPDTRCPGRHFSDSPCPLPAGRANRNLNFGPALS